MFNLGFHLGRHLGRELLQIVSRAGATLAGALLVIGCTGPSKTANTTPALRVYVLECGNVTINDLSLLTPGEDEGTAKKLTNSCFLIDHPKGKLLWDTGIDDRLGPEPVTVFNGGFDLSVTKPLLPQLEEIGVTPDEVDFLALSHFHDDHSGNANHFGGATLLIQRAEFDAAFGPNPELYGFDAKSYAELSAERARVLEGEHDVFGDGRVRILPAPGHSPGHQVLFIELEQTGPVVLSGDLYHFTGARERRTVPSFNADEAATRASMMAIESFLEARGATLWIQHDFEQISSLRHAPAYYD
ncbi:N-acyl homoserine lactonase family protein [Polyangium spumosum]|nr:N-acyl homoserine lactonase family protein [Polyangium spumosum]